MKVTRVLPGLVVLALLVAGPLTSGRIVPPSVGLGIFLGGGILGVLCGIAMIASGVWRLLRRQPGAGSLAAAGLVPLLGAGVVVALFVMNPGPATRFNDVTTDLQDVPAFSQGPAANVPYPEAFRPLLRDAYPDLHGARFEAPAGRVFDVALSIAETDASFDIVRKDRQAGVIEAIARTALFRFEDDVIIRIKDAPGGSIVDMRSRSRIGQGDRGANAERIRKFLATLSKALAAKT